MVLYKTHANGRRQIRYTLISIIRIAQRSEGRTKGVKKFCLYVSVPIQHRYCRGAPSLGQSQHVCHKRTLVHHKHEFACSGPFQVNNLHTLDFFCPSQFTHQLYAWFGYSFEYIVEIGGTPLSWFKHFSIYCSIFRPTLSTLTILFVPSSTTLISSLIFSQFIETL